MVVASSWATRETPAALPRSVDWGVAGGCWLALGGRDDGVPFLAPFAGGAGVGPDRPGDAAGQRKVAAGDQVVADDAEGAHLA